MLEQIEQLLLVYAVGSNIADGVALVLSKDYYS
jgi:hypothetical protein